MPTPIPKTGSSTFPTTLDAFPEVDYTYGGDPAQVSADQAAAINRIEEGVGVAGSTDAASVQYRLARKLDASLADARYSPLPPSRAPANVVLSSDSTGEGGSSQSSGSQASSWFVDYAYASDGAVCIRRNASHSGYTTQQLSAVFASEALAYSPDAVLLGGGRNDIASDIVSVSNSTPAQVYVSEVNGHRVLEGHRVWIVGTGVSDGLWYAHVVDSRTLQLYQNPEMTVGVAGPPSYVSGGVCSGHYGAKSEQIEAARAAGVAVALLTMCPIGSDLIAPSALASLYTQRIEAESALLAQTYGVPLFRVGSWVADAQNRYLPGYSSDGIHPTSFAAQGLIGEGVWSDSAQWIASVRAAKGLAGANVVPPNAAFFTSKYANGIPYQTSDRGGSSVTTFAWTTGPAAGVAGNEASMAHAAGATTSFFGVLPVAVGSGQKVSAGDRCRLELHFRGSNMVASGAFFGIGIARNDGAAYGGNTSVTLQADHAKRGCLSLDFTASSDTTGFVVQVSAGWTSAAQAPTFRYSEIKIVNLTKGGLAS